MPPLVSIIIPAFNSENYLGDTVRSALAQTWPNKEIIIVDDGSSDGTLDIAKQFESRDVKVLTQKNRGAASARNAGLAIARGDFIQWLDADDLLAPDKISLQIAAETTAQGEILHSCAFATFYACPRQARRVSNHLNQDLNARDWLVTALATGHWLPPQAWLVSRRLTERAGPWDERLSLNDDGEYFSRVVSVSSRVKYHPEALCLYRTGNPGSLSRRRSETALNSLLLSLTLTIHHLRKLEDSEQTRAASVAFLQFCVNTFAIKETWAWNGLQQQAQALGGVLQPPAETWQFRAGRALLGENAAMRLKNGLRLAKWTALRGRERIGSLLCAPNDP
jgi:glycosyltransferase involved in cell wall biosynthesis